MPKRPIHLLALVATGTSMAMYLSYIDQIRINLAGDPGSAIQPLFATLNCSLWVALGLLRTPRDWPVVLASLPGIVLGALAMMTSL